MISLGFFGPRVEAQMGGRRFITMYFIAGLCGALLSLGAARVSHHTPIVGASGAIFGVELVYATLWPHDKHLHLGRASGRGAVARDRLYGVLDLRRLRRPRKPRWRHRALRSPRRYVGAFLYLRLIDYRSPLRSVSAKAGCRDLRQAWLGAERRWRGDRALGGDSARRSASDERRGARPRDRARRRRDGVRSLTSTSAPFCIACRCAAAAGRETTSPDEPTRVRTSSTAGCCPRRAAAPLGG